MNLQAAIILASCCLILALITGTLLTVFTATSNQNLAGLPGSGHNPAAPGPGGAASGPAGGASARSSGAPNSGTSAGATSPASPAAGAPSASSTGAANAGVLRAPKTRPGVLPRTTIVVNGQTPVPVQHLTRTMLVLLPAHCQCSAAVSWLIGIAAGAHARTYLIYTSSTETDVKNHQVRR